MFGKKVNPKDHRIHQRYRTDNMSVLIDGVECVLHDYSDGGVRISARGQTRRVALIEIYKHGKCVRKCPAIVAWRRESQAGYAFRSNLKICEIEGAEQYYRQPIPKEEITNNTGAVQGNALRARLKM